MAARKRRNEYRKQKMPNGEDFNVNHKDEKEKKITERKKKL